MSQQADLTQASYQETPYQDQSWEIIGEAGKNESFVPMDVPVLPRTGVMTDPMFADYGGSPDAQATQRWHIPDAVGIPTTDRKRQDEDEGKLKIAPEELEAMKQEAYAAGVEEGKKAAAAEAEAKLQSSQERFEAVFNDLDAQINENLLQLEKSAVQLSIAVAEKVLHHAVEINPEYIGVVVKEALSHAGSSVISRVRVSPEDMEFIDIVGISKHLVDAERSWKFEKDDTIRSGCVIDTSAGEIDFRLDAAWQRVKDQVVKVLR